MIRVMIVGGLHLAGGVGSTLPFAIRDSRRAHQDGSCTIILHLMSGKDYLHAGRKPHRMEMMAWKAQMAPALR